jgi:hypothetical protein
VAKVVFVTNTSLEGYIEDQYSAFDLYEPDDDVFAARRLYETMAVWETKPALTAWSRRSLVLATTAQTIDDSESSLLALTLRLDDQARQHSDLTELIFSRRRD